MNDINSTRSISAIVYLAVIGPCVFILQPGFVQGLVAYLGMTEEQAGLIASYEMFGIAATTVLMSLLASRLNWRGVLRACLALCVVGNLASIGQHDFATLGVLRFLTGLGSGGLVSLTFTMMGLTARPDRNFGYIVVWVLTYGAFGLLAMPWAFATIGMSGVLVFFALFCATGFLFVGPLPASSNSTAAAAAQASSFPISTRLSALAGVLVYNTAVGVVWAYLFLVGLEAGMGEQEVANALTFSQFLGIAGAFLPVVLELRYGRAAPLAVGVLGGAASIYLLLGEVGATGYWLAVGGFNLLWNLCVPYLLAMMAAFDARGRLVVHGVSMQFVGYAVGPFIAASLLGVGGYDLVNGVSVALFLLSAVLLAPGLLVQRRG